MANILGISGSPNMNGNTAYSVKYALSKIPNHHNTKYITLSQKTINPCIGCFKCSENKKCVFNDDMNEIYETIRWCDALIIGSPVYMGMVSAQTKALMDRCVLFRPSYNQQLELSGKIGCGIACGGFRNGGQETTLQNIHTFLLQQNLMVINDGYPFSHAGGTIVGTAQDDKIGLETIQNLVNNIIKALKPD